MAIIALREDLVDQIVCLCGPGCYHRSISLFPSPVAYWRKACRPQSVVGV